MDRSQINEFRRKLAELANSPDTICTFKAYLKATIQRNFIVEFDEINILIGVQGELSPQTRSGMRSRRVSVPKRPVVLHP